MNNKNNSVKNAVWLGAALLTYGKYLYLKKNNIDITSESFWFSQSEIQKFSQQYTNDTVQSARIGQWYNGDHPNSTYNFLRAKGSSRRLTSAGEFCFNKEVPNDLGIKEEYCYDFYGIHICILVGDLLEWVNSTYSQIIYEDKSDSDMKFDSGKTIGNKSILEQKATNSGINKTKEKRLEPIQKLNIEMYIHQFMDLISNNVVEVYNEFSLQHELGIYLRDVIDTQYKIQFERNVSYFDINKLDMLKKEMDIVIYSKDKAEKYCIELKYPTNGQYPEQMFSITKDIKFLEQLTEVEFISCYSVNLVNDRAYYREYENETGIYEMFRKNKRIEGKVVKPTGAKDVAYELNGTYDIRWNDVEGDRKYFVVEVNQK